MHIQILERKEKKRSVFSLGLWLFAGVLFALLFTEVKGNAHLTEADYNAIQTGTIFYQSKEGKFKKGIGLDTKVTMNITGIINRVRIVQKFMNPDDYWTEGKYLFPLPDDASVDTLKMKIGKTIIEGEIQLKQEAKKTYEKAKKAGKKATLVQQERPNLFTAHVANIPPKGEIEVIIEYQQKVTHDNQKYSVKLPLVAGERYIPSSTNGVPTKRADKNIIQAVEDPNQPIDRPVDLDITLNAGFEVKDIKSPYHAIKVDKHHDKYEITIDGITQANKGFELVWYPKELETIQMKFYSQKKEDKRFNLLVITPPSDLFLKNTKKVRREVVFVVDSSGSMLGESMDQAKAALGLAIERLSSEDKFNIIDYDSTYTTLFSTAQKVNRFTLARAESFIDQMKALGGTQALEPITYALQSTNEESENYLRQVIFITDGQLSNESQIFRTVKEKIDNSKLFTVSIGAAPNSFFMKQIAYYGKGTYTSIADINEVSKNMLEFFKKIENQSISDLKINNIDLQLSDLYYGESIYYSFISGDIPHELSLTGKMGDKDYVVKIPVQSMQESSGIDKLWAKDNIDSLMQAYYVTTGARRDEVKSYVEKIALSHHLVSQFTSLVAVEKTPARDKKEILKSQQVQTKIPSGWKMYNANIPQTATSSQYFINVGFLILFFGLYIYFMVQRNENTDT